VLFLRRPRPWSSEPSYEPKAAFLLVGLRGYWLVVMPNIKKMTSASESSLCTSSSHRRALLSRAMLMMARSLCKDLADEVLFTRPLSLDA